MKHIIQVYISKGENYYIAEGVDLPIVTQVKTLDELVVNVKEALELYLEGEDLSDLNKELFERFSIKYPNISH